MYIIYGKKTNVRIMENKKILETLKRFKQLISEEHLYGSLVDNTLIVETNITSRLKSAVRSIDGFGEGIAIKNMNFNIGELTKIADDLEKIYSNVGKIKNSVKSLENVNKSLDDIKKRVNELMTEDSIKNLDSGAQDIKRGLKNDIITNIDAMKGFNNAIKETIFNGVELSDDIKKYIKEDFGEDFLKKIESDIISVRKYKSSKIGKILNSESVNSFKNYSSGLINRIPDNFKNGITNIFNYLLNPKNTKPLKLGFKDKELGLFWKYFLMSWAYYLIINKAYCEFFYSWKDKYNLDDLNEKSVTELTDDEADSKAWLQFMDALGLFKYVGIILPNYSELLECVESGKYESADMIKKMKEGLNNAGVNVSEEDLKNNLNRYKSALNTKINLDNKINEFQNELNKMTPQEKRDLLSN